MSEVREAAVAGQFYPASPEELRQQVTRFLGNAPKRRRAFGIIAPHAGYIYSGAVAGAVYAQVEIPRRVIILCPNHTGFGAPLSIMSQGGFRTPLGEAAIDTPLAEALKSDFPLLREDETAQLREHAVEVQLPFLQAQQPEFTFVPITVGTGQYEVLSALGVVMAKAIAATAEPVLIVASSDMNHYENDEETRIKDALAIEQVLSLQPAGLFQTVRAQDISMCGVGPAVAMLTAALKLGATKAELIRYATSGDVSGDREHVVGYAGIAVM
ncbi:MAG: AmmeMemoRadiSam system protein B [Acidobacteriota bacterium]|nr:AmmeMemoRadiSam system protein B [Acidobacteriota bacterium]